MSSPSRRPGFISSLLAAMFTVVFLLAVPVPKAAADSLREVAERVARQHDGKVIAAREVQRNGRRFYEIRILTRDGVVRTIRVPVDDRHAVELAGAKSFSNSNLPVGRHPGSHSGRATGSAGDESPTLPVAVPDSGLPPVNQRFRFESRSDRN